VKISVIIPAYNEEKSISRVIADIDKSLVQEIIVVNNASTDNTAGVATQSGARVIFESRRGYGQACLTGMRHLSNPDIVVFIDGDYSDYPSIINELIADIEEGKADFVIGSRLLGQAEAGSLTMPQRYGSWLACKSINLFFNQRFTDLGPFRAIRWSTLNQLKMIDKKYGWTVEMQLKAAIHQIKSSEIPVPYRKRIGTSKISGTIKGILLASIYIISHITFAVLKYRIALPLFTKYSFHKPA